MTWRPLSSRGGKTTSVKVESDGSYLFRTEQDDAHILERNRILRDQPDRGYVADGDMRRVASIPMTIVHKWLQEGVDLFSGEQQGEIARRLNDPEYAYLRTAPGRLGPVGDGTYR